MRRIFSLYVEGHSYRSIAAILNNEGIAAPYDGKGYQKPAGRGWGHTTVRAMLKNRRYLGEVQWNRTQWSRVTRRYRQRPEEEWTPVVQRLDLAIIEGDLWDRAQARLGRARRLATPRVRAG